MTVITNSPLPNTGAAHPVRWWAFLGAAVLAPLSFVAIGVIGLHAGLMLTGISAVMSLPGYLCLGLPAAWLAIRRGPGRDGRTPDTGIITVYALIAVALLVPLGTLALVLVESMPTARALNSAMGYAAIGLIVGPVEAFLFAWWYRRFTRGDVVPAEPEIFT